MPDKATVLVVDDDPMLLTLLSDTLNAIGYSSVSVPNAERALEYWGDSKVDLFIVDINLPGMGGLELLSRIKKDKPKLPVILITGVNMNKIESRAYEQGADGFIAKPFRITLIENMMRRLLKQTDAKSSKVLVIDDNEEYREIFGEQLLEIGYDVTIAKDGNDALGKLHKSPINIVFTDYLMPGMDGIELTRRIKEIAPSTHVIIYSGFMPNKKEASEINTTADAFLSKPVSLDQVSEILAQF